MNDPRIFFAAERTLLAWNRTSVSLMALGFVVERFGLIVDTSRQTELGLLQRNLSFLVGVVFILLAAFLAGYSAMQYRRVIRALRASEIPAGYNVTAGVITNAMVALLGLSLVIYLVRGIV